MNENIEIPKHIPLELYRYILYYIPTQTCIICKKKFKTNSYMLYPLCSKYCKIKKTLFLFYNLCMSLTITTICLLIYIRLFIYILFKIICCIIYWLLIMF